MTSNPAALLRTAFTGHQLAFAAMEPLLPAVERIGTALCGALAAGQKILICGNGGSAADAQHFAAERVGRFATERRALAAIALTVDSSALTSISNDFGYAQVFARQVAGLARAGDVLVGISTSGKSENVIAAMRTARELGVTTIAFTGETRGALHAVCDYEISVPSSTTARIQELHIFVIHCLCAVVDENFAE